MLVGESRGDELSCADTCVGDFSRTFIELSRARGITREDSSRSTEMGSIGSANRHFTTTQFSVNKAESRSMICVRMNIARVEWLTSILVFAAASLGTSAAFGQAGIILTGLGDSVTNMDVTEDASNMPNAIANIGFDLNNMPITPDPGGAGDEENVTALLNNVVGGTTMAGNAAKFLDFSGDTMMIPVHIQLAAPRIAKYYTLTSGNDAPERNPYEWRVLGSTSANPTSMADFTPIETRMAIEFSARNQTHLFDMSSNTTAYQTYRFEFETERVAGGPNAVNDCCIQLAELELFENFAGVGAARLTINRGAGTATPSNISMANAGNGPMNIVGYSITSASGALNSNSWTSITDTYDGNSGGSLDTDNWVRLTDTNGRTDLSEVEDPNGNGLVFALLSRSTSVTVRGSEARRKMYRPKSCWRTEQPSRWQSPTLAVSPTAMAI